MMEDYYFEIKTENNRRIKLDELGHAYPDHKPRPHPDGRSDCCWGCGLEIKSGKGKVVSRLEMTFPQALELSYRLFGLIKRSYKNEDTYPEFEQDVQSWLEKFSEDCQICMALKDQGKEDVYR